MDQSEQQSPLWMIKRKEEKIKSIIGKNLPLINKQYSTSLQLARFTDLKIIEDQNCIYQVGYDKDEGENKSLVFFINGAIQPSDKQLFEKFTYLFIKQLDKAMEKSLYTLVYFVGDEVISSGFTRLREYMKMLPVKYYVRMKQMYVYHAHVFVRSFLLFENSKRGKQWKKMTTFIGNLNELFEIPCFHKRWIEYVPQEKKEGKHLQELNEQRSMSINLSPYQDPKNESSSIFGRELSTYTMNSKGIPEVIDHLLSYFSLTKERFQQQGIFRKSGSVQEQMQLAQCLSEGNYNALRVTNDANIVADIIKKLFNSMITPLISYSQYDSIIAHSPKLKSSEDQLDYICSMLCEMSPLNRRVLQVMMSFILNIARFEVLNKMTLYNLSVVFAPCFLCSSQKEKTIKQVQEIGIAINFLNLLLKNFNSIYPHMTYQIFLEMPICSESTSSNSSIGIEKDLDEERKELEEENKELMPLRFLTYQEDKEPQPDMRFIMSDRSKTLISISDSSPKQKPLPTNFCDVELINLEKEVSIKSILDNVKAKILIQIEGSNQFV